MQLVGKKRRGVVWDSRFQFRICYFKKKKKNSKEVKKIIIDFQFEQNLNLLKFK